jgi:hypothetical protein
MLHFSNGQEPVCVQKSGAAPAVKHFENRNTGFKAWMFEAVRHASKQ